MGNLERWSKNESFNDSWNARTREMHELIPNSANTILEFGAGKRHLESLMLAHQLYTPTDIMSRGDDTIICDLNNDPWNYGSYDVAFLSGVLEYIIDLHAFILYLPSIAPTVICSYSDLASDSSVTAMHGWSNCYTQLELNKLFNLAGYDRMKVKKWKTQCIYEFTMK